MRDCRRRCLERQGAVCGNDSTANESHGDQGEPGSEPILEVRSMNELCCPPTVRRFTETPRDAAARGAGSRVVPRSTNHEASIYITILLHYLRTLLIL